MFKTGIVSVTFRKFGAEKIIELCSEAKLDGIEWGGDVHVPAGDFENAVDVKCMTDDASLDVISYGSYYRLGKVPESSSDILRNSEDWDDVTVCADALEVSNIRVWAGNKGSKQASDDERSFWIDNARVICESLEDMDIDLSFEYHGGTLTDTPESAVRLIKEIGCRNAKLYWQPNQFISHEENLQGLEMILPYLSNVHVFAWEGNEKFPLKNHRKRWLEYLEKIKLYDENTYHALLLEFVKDDSEDQFISDAEELRNIISMLR